MEEDVVQSVLPRPTSDHFSIILVRRELRRGTSPLRFGNVGLKQEGFKSIVQKWWEELKLCVTPHFPGVR